MAETFITTLFFIGHTSYRIENAEVKDVDMASMMGMLQSMLQGLMSGSLSITGMLQQMLTGLLGMLGL
ncbi:MAG: hypothetical protein ACXVJJ_08845 [Halobacteriota archaeon]